MEKEKNKIFRRDEWVLEAMAKSWAWELTLHRCWDHADTWDSHRYLIKWIDDLDVCLMTLTGDNQGARNELLQSKVFYSELRDYYMGFCEINQNDESVEAIEEWIRGVLLFIKVKCEKYENEMSQV